VIGGGDWTPDALIADVVRAVAHGRPADVRSPGAFRPWQHVLQALSGYLTLAAKLRVSDDPALCGAWNFGPLPGSELPVRDIVELFIEEWGEGSWRDVSSEEQPLESNILRLSVDKALWELDWKPAWNTRQTVRETARWYRAYFDDPHAVRDLSLEQMQDYEQAMGTDRETNAQPTSGPIGLSDVADDETTSLTPAPVLP
jgi:CDP-glucose 4,6-dehydratase